MFKKLNDLEKAMCSILNKIVNSPNSSIALSNLDKLSAIALFQCVEENFIENIDFYTDANGEYHFSSLGESYVNKNGLKFIRDMSFFYRAKHAAYDLLKGTLGFLLGVLSTVLAEYIVWYFIT